MSNRIEERVCISCGAVLIDMAPEMGMCSTCFKKVNAMVKMKVKHRKDSSGTGKRITLKVGSLKQV